VTAEIAILNKHAVALAADSAVTLSRGQENQKVFNSADKLFELTCGTPIGVMVFNVLDFSEAPLAVLIKEFRSSYAQFDTVQVASEALLEYLRIFSENSPERIAETNLRATMDPLIDLLEKRYDNRVKEKIEDPDWLKEAASSPETFKERLSEILDHILSILERLVKRLAEAEFVGSKDHLLPRVEAYVQERLAQKIATATEEQKIRVQALGNAFFGKIGDTESATGLVVAGYGAKELFPSLVHIELLGNYGGTLKFIRVETVDIDRSGDRSRVLPFAQREMAERFLYGLDARVNEMVTAFCQGTVGSIPEAIFDAVEFEDEEHKEALVSLADKAKAEFVRRLRDEGLQEIRKISQQAVEAMVEFMPKPDLAEFAEALVNLSSLQRRVSSGMETVGGPVDVAVISKAEGFVWVKRKHYFPRELNARYFRRLEGG
jgi:hypothetical protein